MPLIQSPRHTPEDLRHWQMLERFDRVLATGKALERKEQRALETLRAFAAEGPCYVGVSWGKDSVVVAHLAQTVAPEVPLVWVRLEPWENPDCEVVRDAFLAAHPGAHYEEHVVDASAGIDTVEVCDMFARATAQHGRHVSGVRAEESTTRRLRVARWGESTANTCAPIGRWSAADVFAYLALRDLPVHPAYACSFGGTLDRSRLRVDALGGSEGTGRGRAEWERRYYGDVLEAIEARRTA